MNYLFHALDGFQQMTQSQLIWNDPIGGMGFHDWQLHFVWIPSVLGFITIAWIILQWSLSHYEEAEQFHQSDEKSV